MTTHAKFSPSAAQRWLVCTASPNAEAGLPGTTSDSASTGTLIHAVAAAAIDKILMAADVNPSMFPSEAEIARAARWAFTDVTTDPLRYMGERDAHAVDLVDAEDVVDLVTQYAVDVLALTADWSTICTETRVDPLPERPGVMFGTADVIIAEPDALFVVDLKTGRWPVSPDDNKQLLTYACGALYLTDYAYPDGTPVYLAVHQGGTLRVWETTADYVRKFRRELKRAYTESTEGGGEFVPGDHCRWCRAKSSCGAYAGQLVEAARAEFLPTTVDDSDGFMASLDTLPGETFAEMFTRYNLIKEGMEAASAAAARRMYEEGLTIPGYKLVRAIKHKTWSNKDEVVKVLGDGAYRKDLISPSRAIKEFGADAVDGLWHTPVGELRCVAENERGTPVTPTALAEFSHVETETNEE